MSKSLFWPGIQIFRASRHPTTKARATNSGTLWLSRADLVPADLLATAAAASLIPRDPCLELPLPGASGTSGGSLSVVRTGVYFRPSGEDQRSPTPEHFYRRLVRLRSRLSAPVSCRIRSTSA